MFRLNSYLLVSVFLGGCATGGSDKVYRECVRKVNDPDTIVYFAIVEQEKTTEYCECVQQSGDWGQCFSQVLEN